MTDRILDTGAALLRKAMSQKSLTQAKLAEAIGTTQGVISHWITGTRRPSLRMAARLQEMFNVPAISWVDGDEDTELPPTGTEGE